MAIKYSDNRRVSDYKYEGRPQPSPYSEPAETCGDVILQKMWDEVDQQKLEHIKELENGIPERIVKPYRERIEYYLSDDE